MDTGFTLCGKLIYMNLLLWKLWFVIILILHEVSISRLWSKDCGVNVNCIFNLIHT